MLVCMRIAVARFMCVIFVCEIFESIDFAYVLTLKGGRNAATQVLVENKTDSPSKVLIFLRLYLYLKSANAEPFIRSVRNVTTFILYSNRLVRKVTLNTIHAKINI